MYSQHPKIAKEFESATPKGKKLPQHVVKARGIHQGLMGGKNGGPGNSY